MSHIARPVSGLDSISRRRQRRRPVRNRPTVRPGRRPSPPPAPDVGAEELARTCYLCALLNIPSCIRFQRRLRRASGHSLPALPQINDAGAASSPRQRWRHVVSREVYAACPIVSVASPQQVSRMRRMHDRCSRVSWGLERAVWPHPINSGARIRLAEEALPLSLLRGTTTLALKRASAISTLRQRTTSNSRRGALIPLLLSRSKKIASSASRSPTLLVCKTVLTSSV